MNHYAVILHKFGEETGRELLSASCSCGWRSNIWYSHEAFAIESYGRHSEAVAEGSNVAWMVAPQGAA